MQPISNSRIRFFWDVSRIQIQSKHNKGGNATYFETWNRFFRWNAASNRVKKKQKKKKNNLIPNKEYASFLKNYKKPGSKKNKTEQKKSFF